MLRSAADYSVGMTDTASDVYSIPQEFIDFRDTIRQISEEQIAPRAHDIDASAEYPWDIRKLLAENDILGPVSYTHLTLPTIYSV